MNRKITVHINIAEGFPILCLNRIFIIKKIGLAMSDWDIGISKEAMQCVDMVEMMEYDLFDDYGDHSSFDCAQKGI